MKDGKILVVDDDQDVCFAARLLLKMNFSVVHTEQNPQNIPSLLQNENYDVILLDMNFTGDGDDGSEGFYWLKTILDIDPNAVVVMITAYGDVSQAVRAIKEGAADFVLKPWQNEKLIATLFASLDLRASRQQVDRLSTQNRQLHDDLDRPFQEFIGESQAMRAVTTTVRKVAATEANVLILGDNGTGKELVARMLHRLSTRAGKPFVSIDLGSLSESLFESELFGHKKGAFTDAREDRPGRFEVASSGTLFLDEVGNLPPSQQVKLLRVLETRQVTRLGSNQAKDIDVRLVCATNMPLRDMVEEKQFREDLLYRINTVEIPLPPLRERGTDIPRLAEHFLQHFCRKYRKPLKRFHDAALNKLRNYPWPGNVRELRHAIERAVILSDEPVLTITDFPLAPASSGGENLVLDSYNLEEVEKLMIRKVLVNTGGNMSQAARKLGLTRTSLYRRLEKYGL